MTRPERASEPSMDEILASIRKIIAEEPRGLGLSAAEATPPTTPPRPSPESLPPQVAAAAPATAPRPVVSGQDAAGPAEIAAPSSSVRTTAQATIPEMLRELAATIPRAAPTVVTPPVDDDLSDLLEPAPAALPAQVTPPQSAAPVEVATDRVESALDALAAGLAGKSQPQVAPAPPPVQPVATEAVAVQAAEPVMAPEDLAAATGQARIAPADVPETVPGLLAAAQARHPITGPENAAATQSAAVPRTLEDAVVDLLRPLLRNWLDDNLPALVERALQAELAEMSKPHHG